MGWSWRKRFAKSKNIISSPSFENDQARSRIFIGLLPFKPQTTPARVKVEWIGGKIKREWRRVKSKERTRWYAPCPITALCLREKRGQADGIPYIDLAVSSFSLLQPQILLSPSLSLSHPIPPFFSLLHNYQHPVVLLFLSLVFLFFFTSFSLFF